ncbi:MAG: hypothetical protein QOE61_2570, partial [Micromonosporaceae bacterium]|nr:hypothetical protein [Micromonosporaceae bacterium]
MSESAAAAPDQHAEEPNQPQVPKAAEATDAPEATKAPKVPEARVASEAPQAPAKRRRGRKRLVVVVSMTVIAALLLVSGGAAAFYVNSVDLPSPIRLASTTTLYYSDGTVLARLGEINRTEVPYDNLVDGISKVAVAAEDPDFWTGSTGPITRTVVRSAFDIEGDSVSARARVVVAAVKVENMWPKEQILGMYLNDSSFGRVSY